MCSPQTMCLQLLCLATSSLHIPSAQYCRHLAQNSHFSDKVSVISLLSACSPVALLTVTLHYLIHIAAIISLPVYRHEQHCYNIYTSQEKFQASKTRIYPNLMHKEEYNNHLTSCIG